METRVLTTREVGLVIIESGSVISVGDLELIINSKLEIAKARDATGAKIGPLVTSS